MTRFRLLILALAFILPPAAFADGPCRYSELMRLPLAASSEGEPIVTGDINGQPARMLLATGWNFTHILETAAKQRGIPLSIKAGYVFATEKRNRIDVHVTEQQDIGLGPLRVRSRLVPVADVSEEPDVAAVLGADVLLEADLELNLRAKEVALFHGHNCLQRGLSYWDPDAMVLPLRTWQGARPAVLVKLNGRNGVAVINTWSRHSYVLRHFAQQAGFDADKAGEPVKQMWNDLEREKVKMWSADFQEFSIGEETIRQPQLMVISTARRGQRDIDMVLGRDFLQAHRMLISVGQRKVYMSYLGGPVFTSANSDGK